MTVLAFAVETVPDVAAGRRLYDLGDLDDDQVARAMLAVQAQRSGTEVLPPPLHRVVAISLVLRHGERLKVWSLGELDADEDDLVRRFFDGIDKFVPTLVSWNGTGFALPVLHYRALLHGVPAGRWWQMARDGFPYTHCADGLHCGHLDLMRVLADPGPAADRAPGVEVDPMQIFRLLDLPSAPDPAAGKVWETYLSGDIESIRDACEIRALNIYQVYLHFERMRATLAADRYRAECDKLRECLESDGRAHLRAYAEAWQGQA
jgi:predicted PolB exonuclease-like 3'-5' exonuclease